MKTIEEIRHAWLSKLIEKHGSIAALNEALGRARTDATLTQIRNMAPNTRSGKVRNMGSELAREIEEKLGMERGTLDNQPRESAEEIASSFPVIHLPYAPKRGLSSVLTELQTVIDDGLPPLLQDAARMVLSKWLHGQASLAAVVAAIEGMQQIETGSDSDVKKLAA